MEKNNLTEVALSLKVTLNYSQSDSNPIFAQLRFTCSKSTRETLGKGVKCSKLTKHENDVFEVVLVFLFLTVNIFYTFS